MLTINEDDERKFSKLSIDRTDCPRCGAIWLNGEHVWSTGNKGCERTLSNLVCSKVKDPRCINPQRKDTKWLGYDTWEKREKFINDFFDKYDLTTNEGLSSAIKDFKNK